MDDDRYGQCYSACVVVLIRCRDLDDIARISGINVIYRPDKSGRIDVTLCNVQNFASVHKIDLKRHVTSGGHVDGEASVSVGGESRSIAGYNQASDFLSQDNGG